MIMAGSTPGSLRGCHPDLRRNQRMRPRYEHGAPWAAELVQLGCWSRKASVTAANSGEVKML
jgi:hypothetical protein